MLFFHEVLQQVHEVILYIVVSGVVVSAVGRVMVDDIAGLTKRKTRRKRNG
jgi:hypothetical protein